MKRKRKSRQAQIPKSGVQPKIPFPWAVMITVALVVAVSTIQPGCAVRSTGVNANPIDTPAYRAQQSLKILADANKAATEVVIKLNTAKVIPDDTTKQLLAYNRAVALFEKAATIVLQSGQTPTQKAAAIQQLIAALPSASIQGWLSSNQPQAEAAIAGVLAVQNTIALLTTTLGSLK